MALFVIETLNYGSQTRKVQLLVVKTLDYSGLNSKNIGCLVTQSFTSLVGMFQCFYY